MKLASFDIFDTTLIRKCGLPENIFYLLAHRLYPEDRALREEFLLWRQIAEEKARCLNSGKEVSLNDIYSGKEGMEVELQIEAENLIANPEIKNVIEQKRCEGYSICFISDMYLSSAFLVDMLKREGCLLEDEQVFVSCEENARKSSGKLFEVVRDRLQPAEWIHYGDNTVSDVKIPRRIGINAIQVRTFFTETERLILNQCKEHQAGYEMSILAGLSRAARLLHGKDAYAEIAADFIAPSYIPYVSFLLKDAQSRGVTRLYFLSRDSHILMKLAETQKVNYPNMEFRYLFVSRKSLLLPFLKNADVVSYLSVQDHHTVLRNEVDVLLKQLSTNRSELKSKFGIAFSYTKIYGKKEEQDFLDKIFGIKSAFLPELKKRVEEQRDLLLNYFRQEGLLEEGRFAMVDVGWLGTSRLMINDILQSVNASPAEFYYYGVRRDVYSSGYGRYTSYYRANQLSTELTALVENYFSASPYPSTIGYIIDGAEVKPLFEEGKDFHDTVICRTNREISQWIWKEMSQMKLPFEMAFWDWSKVSLNAISNLSVRIDLTAFGESDDFDKASFMRKLSFVELFRMLILGEHVTAFDKASLQWTCGRRLYPLLWSLHDFSGKVRRRLYLKFVK